MPESKTDTGANSTNKEKQGDGSSDDMEMNTDGGDTPSSYKSTDPPQQTAEQEKNGDDKKGDKDKKGDEQTHLQSTVLRHGIFDFHQTDDRGLATCPFVFVPKGYDFRTKKGMQGIFKALDIDFPEFVFSFAANKCLSSQYEKKSIEDWYALESKSSGGIFNTKMAKESESVYAAKETRDEKEAFALKVLSAIPHEGSLFLISKPYGGNLLSRLGIEAATEKDINTLGLLTIDKDGSRSNMITWLGEKNDSKGTITKWGYDSRRKFIDAEMFTKVKGNDYCVPLGDEVKSKFKIEAMADYTNAEQDFYHRHCTQNVAVRPFIPGLLADECTHRLVFEKQESLDDFQKELEESIWSAVFASGNSSSELKAVSKSIEKSLPIIVLQDTGPVSDIVFEIERKRSASEIRESFKEYIKESKKLESMKRDEEKKSNQEPKDAFDKLYDEDEMQSNKKCCLFRRWEYQEQKILVDECWKKVIKDLRKLVEYLKFIDYKEDEKVIAGNVDREFEGSIEDARRDSFDKTSKDLQEEYGDIIDKALIEIDEKSIKKNDVTSWILKTRNASNILLHPLLTHKDYLDQMKEIEDEASSECQDVLDLQKSRSSPHPIRLAYTLMSEMHHNGSFNHICVIPSPNSSEDISRVQIRDRIMTLMGRDFSNDEPKGYELDREAIAHNRELQSKLKRASLRYYWMGFILSLLVISFTIVSILFSSRPWEGEVKKDLGDSELSPSAAPSISSFPSASPSTTSSTSSASPSSEPPKMKIENSVLAPLVITFVLTVFQSLDQILIPMTKYSRFRLAVAHLQSEEYRFRTRIGEYKPLYGGGINNLGEARDKFLKNSADVFTSCMDSEANE